MSGTESFASVFSHIVDIDLIQTINNVKSGLLTEQTAFGFDLFKQHGDKLRSLQQLIDAVPEDDSNDEKRQKVQTAIENLVSDIGLPFLRSFAPSFDGRAETAAAVLNICDFISVCLKRSSQKIGIEILELCLQSLIAFHNECEKHCENASGEVVDVLCAIELLCTSLEVVSLSENNQNEDLLTKAFSASLSVLPHLEEKKANRLISFVIMKLTQDQAQRRSAYLQAVWTFIEEDTARQNRTVGPKSLQLHLTVMCSMANFFFPLTDEAVVPDVRQCPTFWKNVQLGLYSDNPAVRKRSIYLVKRIVDTCEKSALDFIPVKSSLDDPSAEVPYFLWSKPHQETLSRVWEDVFLLFETLDEKQTHVIKPILPRMQALLNAAKIEKGCPALHTSWIVTLLMRAFNHESVFIMRWAAETVLFMDFSSLPFLRQGQLQFLTEKLLGFLQDLKLYHRPDGCPVGSCSAVGRGLKQFFASVCRSLENQKDKAQFVQHVLWTLRKENWSSVPLVFITQGLSCISPEPILDPTTLASVREIIMSSLTTLETFTRGAIECFLAKMVLNLIDKSTAGVEDLMETLAAMQREESLQRGTTLWAAVVAWLVRSATGHDPPHPAWTWPALQATLHALLDSYLTVTPDTSGHALSECLRVTKIGRLVTLMADCEGRMAEQTGAGAEGDRTSPLLTATLGRAVEVINSVNTRVYMPKLKADRAVYLLLLCAKDMKRGTEGKRDVCGEQLCSLAQSCWKELLLYVKRRVFDGASDDEGDPMELDQVVFYSEAVQALGEAIPRGAGLPSMQELVHACTAVLHPPTTPSTSTTTTTTTTTPSPTTPSTTPSTLHHVAAVSLLAAVAQVLEAKLKGEGDREEGDREEGVRPLFSHLCTVIAAMPVDCTVLAANRGAGSAHHGRLVSQYMVCQWRCVRVVLTHRPLLLQADQVLRSALEAFSVSSGETDVPIMQCLEMVMPRLVGREEEEGRVEEVVEVAWGKVHEEIKSWSFWLKMEAYVRLVLQRPLLCLMADPGSQLGGHMAKVLQRFFEVGQEKSGLLNLVMSRLCDLWGQEGGMTLALAMVPTIVDACMFGTLHKKAERLWLDVCMYIETLGAECSVNEILSSSSKNDIYVRLMTLNFLSALRPGRGEEEAVGRGVVGEAWSRYWALAQLTTFRQYTNTLPHRHKHRLLQTLPLLDHFIQEDCCQEFCRKIWEGLVVECHPSVRQNLEWLAMRLFHRFPSLLLPFLWDYFHQFRDKRNVSLLSLLHVVTHLGPHLPEDMRAGFYRTALPLVVPWAMAHHFNTRLHGQAAMHQLWTQCQRLGVDVGHLPILDCCMQFLMTNGNSSAVLDKLLGNYFYNHFHFLKDYSMETLLHTLPRLACLSDDEWMHPDLFRQLDPTWQSDGPCRRPLPLYNLSPTLAACEPGPWKMKATAETSEESSASRDGDVQKKVIPWRLLAPDSAAEQEYSCRRRQSGRGDGLVLVTSLINKLPNLGGLCRTSEIFGVSEFVVGNLSYLNDRTFQSLSVTAEKWIPVTEVPFFRLSEYLEEKRRESYTLVGVEQTANSVPLTRYTFPAKTLLLLGNEKEGIAPDLLQQLDVCVEIPQQGIIRSLNVHVSGALLVWEYTRQHLDLA